MLNDFFWRCLLINCIYQNSPCIPWVSFVEKRKKEDAFLEFVDDVILSSGMRILRLIPQDYLHLIQVQKKFRLDFDDAYQYCLAEKYNLEIVSFDSDFDTTDRKRKVPSEIARL